MQLIAAADARWGIGKDGQLLISIPADMKYFQSVTGGHTIIMGRKTLESFPGKRPLRNRRNIVLTHNEDYKVKDAETVHSVAEALELIRDTDKDEVFCVGGAGIYRLFLPYCDTALITRIEHIYDADAFMPDLDKDPDWEKISESEEQVFCDLIYHFCTYRRIGKERVS
ncbi:MAG: dihydrofolate reductase [Lachnospiraceae bacterium]|jgi:dihydrofolate reductase|nr:dihydrofolate reductase [Lachnospiraceae bacterium]